MAPPSVSVLPSTITATGAGSITPPSPSPSVFQRRRTSPPKNSSLGEVMMNKMFSGKFLSVAAAAVLFLPLQSQAEDVNWAALNPEVAGATNTNSSSECLECHEEFMQTFAYSIHGRSLPNGGCESCHGPMSKHIEAPRQEPALV